jgi:hypothetical protein
MLYNRKIDRTLIVLVPVALFIYASTRPTVRLRADMPPQFADSPAIPGAKHLTDEERMARRYWDVAVSSVQWRFTYASPLPETPPEYFRVYGDPATGAAPPAESRLRYWRRLQQIWLSPAAWKTTHEWNTRWLVDPIMQAGNWFDRTFKDFVSKP